MNVANWSKFIIVSAFYTLKTEQCTSVVTSRSPHTAVRCRRLTGPTTIYSACGKLEPCTLCVCVCCDLFLPWLRDPEYFNHPGAGAVYAMHLECKGIAASTHVVSADGCENFIILICGKGLTFGASQSVSFANDNCWGWFGKKCRCHFFFI